jgi:hypothetical protein
VAGARLRLKNPYRLFTFDELRGDLCHALTKDTRRFKITLGRYDLRGIIVRLCHQPKRAAKTVDLIAIGTLNAFHLRRQFSLPYPDHPLLRRKNGKLDQGGKFITAERAGVRETRRYLVSPLLCELAPGTGINERFERRRNATHICGRTEDDRIRLIKRRPIVFRDNVSFDNF